MHKIKLTKEQICNLAYGREQSVHDGTVNVIIALEEEKTLSDDERQKMIEALVDEDIKDIRQAMFQDDYEFLNYVLRGSGFYPYELCSDQVIKSEYEERIKVKE